MLKSLSFSRILSDAFIPDDFATKVKQIHGQSDLIWMSCFTGPSYLTITSRGPCLDNFNMSSLQHLIFPIQGFIRKFEHIFKNFSRTFPGQLMKVPSNTAGGLGAPKILYFIVPENGLKIHIFPVCCSAKTHDKVIKIVTQCLS